MTGIIDVHTHPTLPVWREVIAKATGQSPDNLKMFQASVPAWNAEWHVGEMDRLGIQSAVLSMPGVAHLAAGEQAKRLCRQMNDEIAKAISDFPDRFAAFGILPLDDMDAALDETAYVLDILKFDGVGIGTNFSGRYLGDTLFDPLLLELNSRKSVLFAHSSPPPGFSPDGGLDPSILEFMFDTTRMLLNMVLSGARRRFSDINIISTHGGGTIPYLAGRITVLEPLLGAGAGRPTMSASDIMSDLSSFYYDLTASTSHAALDAIRRLVPDSQLLFGSDTPMMPSSEIAPAVENLHSYGLIPDQDLTNILSRNALHLLPNLSERVSSRASLSARI